MDILIFIFVAFVVVISGDGCILHVYFVLKYRIHIEYVHVSDSYVYKQCVLRVNDNTTLFMYFNLCLPKKQSESQKIIS